MSDDEGPLDPFVDPPRQQIRTGRNGEVPPEIQKILNAIANATGTLPPGVTETTHVVAMNKEGKVIGVAGEDGIIERIPLSTDQGEFTVHRVMPDIEVPPEIQEILDQGQPPAPSLDGEDNLANALLRLKDFVDDGKISSDLGEAIISMSERLYKEPNLIAMIESMGFDPQPQLRFTAQMVLKVFTDIFEVDVVERLVDETRLLERLTSLCQFALLIGAEMEKRRSGQVQTPKEEDQPGSN